MNARSVEGAPAGNPDERRVRRLFARFAKAVDAGDFESFQALHAREVRADLDRALFDENCARARAHGFAFRPLRLWFEGDTGTLTFAVTPSDGDRDQIDEAELVLVKDEGKWRILES